MSHLPYTYTAGMNNGAEFLVSGWPFGKDITAGDTVNFPWVTNEIYATNPTGTTQYVGFTAVGVAATSRIAILPNSTLTLKIKVSTLYTAGAGAMNIGASLTNILPTQYPTLSGSATIIHNLDDETLVKAYPGV